MGIIVVGNEKGGCGKTTIAVNLAAMAAGEGLDVILVDADPGQQSAARWVSRRRDHAPEAATVHCVSLSGRMIGTQLQDLATRYAVVIVDTGAEDSQELRAGAVVADVLVIPVQPEPLDLWTLPTAEHLYARAKTLNPKLRAVIVANRTPHQNISHAPDDVRAFMTDNAPDLAEAPLIPLVGRTAYGRAIADGLALGETKKPDQRALIEMDRLYREVMQ